jgi:hypothetical protein
MFFCEVRSWWLWFKKITFQFHMLFTLQKVEILQCLDGPGGVCACVHVCVCACACPCMYVCFVGIGVVSAYMCVDEHMYA